MMNHEYQDLILKVSNEIAREFIRNEEKLASRALLPDADIADIARETGLRTTSIVLEDSRDKLVKKTVGRFDGRKKSDNLFQCDFWKD